jgi:hypothetical protein
MAKLGWWISAPPILSGDEHSVQVPTAGKQLIIDLNTGDLSVQ